MSAAPLDAAVAAAVFRRTWSKIARRPVVLLLSFVQPLIWMTFFGFLFHRFALGPLEGTVTYLDFLMPGVCGLTVLLGASQSGITYIRDMQTSFLERLLAAPSDHHALLIGKVGADVSRLLVQALLVCGLGMLLGARIEPSAVPLLLAIVFLAVFAAGYACLSCVIALRTRAHESMAAFIHLVNMPLFFTSTALVPAKQMPPWLATVAAWNPFGLVVDALRGAMLFGTGPSMAAGGLLLALSALLYGAAGWALKGARAAAPG